jgi:hypothetical protein
VHAKRQRQHADAPRRHEQPETGRVPVQIPPEFLEGMEANQSREGEQHRPHNLQPQRVQGPEKPGKHGFELDGQPSVSSVNNRVESNIMREKTARMDRPDPLEDRLELDDNLKNLFKDLAASINDALSGSEDIAKAIKNVRGAGYDVFLVLEATIGFRKRDQADSGEGSADALEGGEMKLRVTAQDLKFLRSLKLSVEDLNSQ